MFRPPARPHASPRRRARASAARHVLAASCARPRPAMLRGLRCCMDLSGPRNCGGCTATSEALPPAEIVRICRRHPKDSGGKQFRSVAALFRAASTVVIAVDAIVRTRMGGGRARVSATIVPAKAFRRAAQARARDHGRPHDRWKAEGRDHDDPVILRGREHRAFSRENRNRFPASARRGQNLGNGVWLDSQFLPASSRSCSSRAKHMPGASRRSRPSRTKTDSPSQGGTPTSPPRKEKRANAGSLEEAIAWRQ